MGISPLSWRLVQRRLLKADHEVQRSDGSAVAGGLLDVLPAICNIEKAVPNTYSREFDHLLKFIYRNTSLVDIISVIALYGTGEAVAGISHSRTPCKPAIPRSFPSEETPRL